MKKCTICSKWVDSIQTLKTQREMKKSITGTEKCSRGKNSGQVENGKCQAESILVHSELLTMMISKATSNGRCLTTSIIKRTLWIPPQLSKKLQMLNSDSQSKS
jgi:hypothetical protein